MSADQSVIDSLKLLPRRRSEIVSRSPVNDADVNSLVEESEKKGREVGLHNLSSQEAINLLDSRLGAAAARLFRLPAPKAEAVADLESALENERVGLEAKAAEISSRPIEKPPLPEAIPIPWEKAFLNSFALFALAGVSAKLAGLQPGWLDILALALCALLVAANWAAVRVFLLSLPARLAFLARIASRRFALFRIRRRISMIAGRQARVREEVAQGALRRSQAEEWASQIRPLLLSHFEYERARAEKAASIHRIRQQAYLPEVEISESSACDVRVRGLAAQISAD
ncbi:MAG: hypothetical protein AB1631_23345 [Acidobacteriota bacterium]